MNRGDGGEKRNKRRQVREGRPRDEGGGGM